MTLEFKDAAQFLAYAFLAGGAWVTAKFLKEAIVKLETILVKVTETQAGHETRITVLETKKGARKK